MTASYVPTPADMDALVREARARGIDPLDVAVSLFFESAGFDPASVRRKNDGTFLVGGLNQMTAANLHAYGIDPEDWIKKSAAEQLPTIFRFWDGLAKSFAGGTFPPDDAHLEALNYLPARYRDRHAATDPHAVLTQKGDHDIAHSDGTWTSYYDANTPLDPKGTGAISLDTIRDVMVAIATSPSPRWALVRDAVLAAKARAVTPKPPALPPPATPPSSPSTPVASTPSSRTKAIAGLAFVALAAAIVKGRALLVAVAAAIAHAGGC